MEIDDYLRKARAGELFSKLDLTAMLAYPVESPENIRIMAEANRLSKELSQNQAEVHAQLALNLAPCPGNCGFCSFAQKNGVFQEEIRLKSEQAVRYAQQFEADGANAVFVMITANYPFELFIDMSQEIRRNLKKGTLMIANVGDQSLEHAKLIKDTGYAGVYHARRLREGIDTVRSHPRRERKAFGIFRKPVSWVGTCVEPVGPEHSNDELAEEILFTAAFAPAYSGAARRITIPGTPMASRGMISELRMSQIVAVTRLAMPRTVLGNCTHEPCTLGAVAGANLFWAQVGGNPRDVKKKTEEGRGETVQSCKKIFYESYWEVWNGPSRFYTLEKPIFALAPPDKSL